MSWKSLCHWWTAGRCTMDCVTATHDLEEAREIIRGLRREIHIRNGQIVELTHKLSTATSNLSAVEKEAEILQDCLKAAETNKHVAPKKNHRPFNNSGRYTENKKAKPFVAEGAINEEGNSKKSPS